MNDTLLAQADGLMPFPLPGAETLPAWVMIAAGLFYAALLAWNAASSFGRGRKQIEAEVGKPAPAVQPNLAFTGGAFADRDAIITLAGSATDLADAIREALGEKSPALRRMESFIASVVRLAEVYEKRVQMDERDSREEEIRRRVEDHLRRNGSGR